MKKPVRKEVGTKIDEKVCAKTLARTEGPRQQSSQALREILVPKKTQNVSTGRVGTKMDQEVCTKGGRNQNRPKSLYEEPGQDRGTKAAVLPKETSPKRRRQRDGTKETSPKRLHQRDVTKEMSPKRHHQGDVTKETSLKDGTKEMPPKRRH